MIFKNLDSIFLTLFLIVIFFFKIPSFYIFPFFPNALLTTQAIARIMLILIFVFNVYKNYTLNKKIINGRDDNIFTSLILLLFCIQSLSSLFALNIFSLKQSHKYHVRRSLVSSLSATSTADWS